MKMLFYSSDRSEVEAMRDELFHAGISCEVRDGETGANPPPDIELWIHNDQDSHRALLLFVELGLGYARRPITATVAEEDAEQQDREDVY